MSSKTVAPVTSSRRTSRRTRLIAGTVIFAGMTGATLAFAGSASASTTVIDAQSNPTAAAAAMAQFATATDKTFTPEADPLYHSTGWTMPAGTSVQENDGKPGSLDTSASWTFGTTKTSSWSLGGEVDLSAGGGIGFANVTVSVDLSASHTWGTSTSDSETITGEVPAGESEWILESTSEATYTGSYKFTAADGTTYEIDNVTITTPVGKGDNPNAAVSYRVVEGNINKIAAALNVPAAHLDTTKLSAAQVNVVSQKLGLTK